MPDTSRKIGPDTFRVSPLDFEAATDLMPLIMPAAADYGRLYALFMGTAAELVGAGVDVGDLDTTSMFTQIPKLQGSLAGASAIIASICEKLPPERLRAIRRTLLAGATMNGKPLYAQGPGGGDDMINDWLRGRTLDGWRLILLALEVNYPDFFALVRPLVAGRKDGAHSDSTATTPATGSGAG